MWHISVSDNRLASKLAETLSELDFLYTSVHIRKECIKNRNEFSVTV